VLPERRAASLSSRRAVVFSRDVISSSISLNGQFVPGVPCQTSRSLGNCPRLLENPSVGWAGQSVLLASRVE
jgi:hypothetical protein